MGIALGFEEIAADEFYAMLVIEEEQDRHERDVTSKS